MSDELKGIWTAKGLEKLAAAYAGGAPLVLRQIAVGDGGGSVPAPAPSWTGLAAEKWRGNVNAVMVNPDAPTEVVADVVLPFNVGGFFIREWGLFDEAGDMVAVGPHAETYKPLIAEGTAVEVTERIRLPLTNSAAVTLTIASAAMATQQYVRQYVTQVVEGHDAAADAHAGRLDALAEALATHGHAYATEETPGFVRRATDEEAAEGADTEDYVTPKQLADALGRVDLSGIMAALAGKVDKSAWVTLVADRAYLLPNGMILQWGTQLVAGAYGTAAITFPSAFPNACFGALVTSIERGQFGSGVRNVSKTGFTILNGSDSGSLTFQWLAYGR